MHTILNTSSKVEEHDTWDYSFSCDDSANMPSFELLYGGHWFTVKPEDYVIQLNGPECALCLSPYDSLNTWILGDAFLRGYYSIHKHDTKQMGFVPLAESFKTAPVLATSTPTATLPKVELIVSYDTLIFYIVVAILVVVLGGALIWFFCYLNTKVAANKIQKSTEETSSQITLLQ